MHIMIYNKIVIFKNYITTCLWKTMKGTVITYCEASKKIPKCYWQYSNTKKRDKGRQRRLSSIPVNFLWKPWGCLWPPSALEQRQGKRRDSESRESVIPLRTWPSTGNIKFYHFPGRKDEEINWEPLLIYPWMKYIKSPSLRGRGRIGKPMLASCR